MKKQKKIDNENNTKLDIKKNKLHVMKLQNSSSKEQETQKQISAREYLFNLDPNICLIVCRDKKSIYGWKKLGRKELNQKYEENYKSYYNHGIATGFIEENDEYGIMGIDIDSDKNFDEFIKKNKLNKKEIENTYTEKSPSGSIHYYFKIDERLRHLTIGQNFPCEKVDYRCNGGYMICYGSKFSKTMCKKYDYEAEEDYHRCGGSDEKCSYENKSYKIIKNTQMNYLPDSWVKLFIPINEKDKQNKENELNKITGVSNKSKINKIKNNLSSTVMSAGDINENDESFIINDLYKIEWKTIKLFFDKCYKQYRFENYDDWLKTGMALKNRYEEDGFILFKYFSNKSRNPDTDHELHKKYDSFKIDHMGGITIRTLYYFAKEDNREEYIKIVKEQSIFNKFELTSTDIVKYIKILSNRFIWVQQTLYCYNGKYWETDDIEMKRYIGNELYDFLKEIYINCYFDDANSKERERISVELKRLKTLTFKKEIVETSRETLTNNNIKFDNKSYLLGFTNIVYDLIEHQFRDYKYDDYITITTGYEWNEPTSDQINKINNLICSIFPKEDERNSFLTILSTGLDGRALEKFFIFNGEGRNGKGFINDLFLLALGNYGMIGNNAILFETRKTGGNPEIAKIDKKRYVVFREPPEKRKFENSVIKELTGGGNIGARDIYEGAKKAEKELNLTCVCECNKRPTFSEEPKIADMKRILDILFRVTFTDNKEEIDEENNILLANLEYKDKNFQNNHKFALLKILFDVYKQYVINHFDLCVPKSIMDRTKKYLEMSSDIIGWINDKYEKTEDITDIITIKEMYRDYKESEFYSNLSKADKRKNNENDFREKISENIFLKKYYFKQKTINGIKYNNAITNYKKKEQDYDEF